MIGNRVSESSELLVAVYDFSSARKAVGRAGCLESLPKKPAIFDATVVDYTLELCDSFANLCVHVVFGIRISYDIQALIPMLFWRYPEMITPNLKVAFTLGFGILKKFVSFEWSQHALNIMS